MPHVTAKHPAEAGENPLEQAEASAGKPVRWWQWLLVYPTLAISLIGAVPSALELYKSNKFGVAFGKSGEAEEQNSLWQANFDCLPKSQFQSITNKFNVQVGSAVCDSGDVLLRILQPGGKDYQYKWVAWNDLTPQHHPPDVAALLGIGAARADPVAPRPSPAPYGPASLLCQRWIGQGQLLNRVSTPQGCYDEIINTYNGMVLSTRQAPCTQAC